MPEVLLSCLHCLHDYREQWVHLLLRKARRFFCLTSLVPLQTFVTLPPILRLACLEAFEQ